MKINGTITRFLQSNIDTDIIIPAVFLKRTVIDGYEPFSFYEKRYLPDTVCEPDLKAKDFVFKKTHLNPDFPLNHPNCRDASFLLTWENFGCGSSREHAVYALKDFKVIIGSAPGGKSPFADIFRDNCRQNLIWTPVITPGDHKKLNNYLDEHLSKGTVEMIMDTEQDLIRTADNAVKLSYAIPAVHKSYIHKGKDPLELAKEEISRYNKVIDPWFTEHKKVLDRFPVSKSG